MTAPFAPQPPDARPGPPVWCEAEQVWRLTRYADVSALLRKADAEVVEFQDRIAAIGRRAGRDYGSLVRLLSGILFFRNPPWQTEARAALRRALGAMAARISEAEIAPLVEDAVAGLLADAEGNVDVVAPLADRVPVLVMAHLLGLSEATVETLHLQGKGVVNAWQRAMPLRAYDALQQQAAGIDAALRQEIDRARADGGPLRMFLEAGEFVEDDETVGILFGIIMAGIETTSGLLASVLYAACLEPGAAEALRQGSFPERGFVEEVLRMAPPVRRPSARRLATAQQFGDIALPPGSLVGVDLMLAQRDPAAYEDPHRFDARRQRPTVLAFGSGIHACLGGHLATLEARLLLRSVLRRGVSPAPGAEIEWDPDPTFCRLLRFRLRLDHERKRPLHAE
ncbi:cytochrome P450 [Sediminicoccus rosea]|uniref:Cytochrome P450 n=1 Tax=Sediminicoccus rosea TaxID=1225128 RepID=A0ABZ0PN64_9PROT|nr:cytochrome P450 [Sediminicoccus rosea]WPB86906.1 cytochrome P450 [Sediminicoccus rosea]